MRHVNGDASNGKTVEDKLASQFQKIDRRLAKQKRKRRHKHKHFIWSRQRWRDLRIIFEQRDGWVIDDTNINDELKWGKAEAVGQMLRLTTKERGVWKITTIRPCDQTLEELRKAKRRERDHKRRIYNRQPRAQYLASHITSRTKPWEQEGISRRTWYRRLAQMRGTGMSPTTYSYMLGRTPAPLPVKHEDWPVAHQLGYLLVLHEYRRLTSRGISKIVPGLAACSELRRGVA